MYFELKRKHALPKESKAIARRFEDFVLPAEHSLRTQRLFKFGKGNNTEQKEQITDIIERLDELDEVISSMYLP
ncbi:hypothetical protein CC2G_011226 [Coprinopsis cinerea AmutBmut pab1-1]|nr:hypothetical protein CC2G_011226 [Coprinopsis cinerea AmutBmut pab1-1]